MELGRTHQLPGMGEEAELEVNQQVDRGVAGYGFLDTSTQAQDISASLPASVTLEKRRQAVDFSMRNNGLAEGFSMRDSSENASLTLENAVSEQGDGNSSLGQRSCSPQQGTPLRSSAIPSNVLFPELPIEVPSHEHSSTTSDSGGAFDEDDDAEECDSQLLDRAGVTMVDGTQIPPLLSENLVLCINAGGAAIPSTSLGADFSADGHFEGGDVLRTGENITSTQDPSLYQTARYGNFSYSIRELPPGEYLVDLHFAEIIFTNGPPGMRTFDVFVQNEKVASKLDIYSKVGSNTPLVLLNAKASVKDEGLSISFRGIVGSPTINGICVRRALQQESRKPVQKQLEADMHLQIENPVKDLKNVQCEVLGLVEPPQSYIDQTSKQKVKSKARNCVREYEMKIDEMKKEIHQAWMSVQDANRINEKLQSELDCKSFHVDSLAQAVEGQLNELKDVKEKAENEIKYLKDKLQNGRQHLSTVVLELAMKLQVIKREYTMLAMESHEWVRSFPQIQSMTANIKALVDEHEELKKKYVKQGQDLRTCYNQVLELKGNIRVFCRCRPLSMTEVNTGSSSILDFDAAHDNELIVRLNGGGKKIFKFDHVFTPSDNQVDVFLDTAPVVVSVLDGYNVCIFAYGQTGTGKTFTMEGTENNRGVNYRTLEELFRVASQRRGQYEYHIDVSVVEVYNEQIRDLLAPPLALGQHGKKLEIKQVAEGVHHVPGLTEARVHCMEEVWEVLQTGSSARAVGSTNANEHSSRSHCMLCVMVKGENLLTGDYTRSKLWLVDLAGSERVAKTDVQGERLKEAQSINKSLSALGDVIYALTTKSSHVPYRNSKLTHLLQDSLGGESKTLMFVQISPSEQDVGETLCSLNFASRVRGVELGPARKQVDPSELVKYKQMVEKSKQDGRKLEDAMKTKEQTCKVLSDKVKEFEGVITIERKARSIAEAKLKEQQQLVEKLTEQLKVKESSENAAHRRQQEGSNVAEACILRKPLRENPRELTEGLLKPVAEDRPQKEGDGNGEEGVLMAGRVKASPKGRLRRPGGRASICGVPRRRTTMAVVPMYSGAPLLVAGKGEDVRSSSESLQQDSFADENLPTSGLLLPPAPTSIGGGAGSMALKRNVPRKFQIKLQPSSLLPPQPSSVLLPQRTASDTSILGLQKKRDQTQVVGGGGSGVVGNCNGSGVGGEEKQCLNKMRRVSIATTWGKHPPVPQHTQLWAAGGGGGATTATIAAATSAGAGVGVAVATGGAQRVLAAKPHLHNRERGWNR